MQAHKCSICGKNDVKLYRPYSEFLRNERIKCGEHVPAQELIWYVPLIEDQDGSVWGYTSVPQDAIAKWKALPGVDLLWVHEQ